MMIRRIVRMLLDHPSWGINKEKVKKRIKEIDEEEEEQLRDLAIRLGAAIDMAPEDVLEGLIIALRADTMFKQRELVRAMKNDFWEEKILPIYKAMLDEILLDNHKG